MTEYITEWHSITTNDDFPDVACAKREEIVRCRDCEYYDGEPDMESMGEKCWRDPSHSGRSIPTIADGFCWRGKRKEGGDAE